MGKIRGGGRRSPSVLQHENDNNPPELGSLQRVFFLATMLTKKVTFRMKPGTKCGSLAAGRTPGVSGDFRGLGGKGCVRVNRPQQGFDLHQGVMQVDNAKGLAHTLLVGLAPAHPS